MKSDWEIVLAHCTDQGIMGTLGRSWESWESRLERLSSTSTHSDLLRFLGASISWHYLVQGRVSAPTQQEFQAYGVEFQT